MYDIYLNKTLKAPPEMDTLIHDFLQEVPTLANPSFQQRLFPRSRIPGVLGLELPKELAKRLNEGGIIWKGG
jgi:hypothetical protein